MILLVTYSTAKKKSYFHLLQLRKKFHLLSFTFQEEDLKKELIGEIKKNVGVDVINDMEKGKNRNYIEDNYKITINSTNGVMDIV